MCYNFFALYYIVYCNLFIITAPPTPTPTSKKKEVTQKKDYNIVITSLSITVLPSPAGQYVGYLHAGIDYLYSIDVNQST